MSPRNDDISLIIAKAKLNGNFPDVKDEELDAVQQYANTLFGDDTVFGNTFLKRGHTDYLTPTAPMIELATSAGSGRIFHLISGIGSTSEIVGVGVDNPGTTGYVFSIKSSNNIGIGVNLETTSAATSIGYLGAVLSSGTGIEMRKGNQNGGTLVNLRADFGGSGTLFQWGFGGATNVNGYIDVDGSVHIQSGTSNQTKIKTSAVSGGTQDAHYVYSGTPNLWFPNAVSASSNSFKLQQGSAAAIGAEVMTTLIELKNANQIGFFGVTPVGKAAAIASPTSDSVGTKAAIDAIRTALTNIGITA